MLTWMNMFYIAHPATFYANTADDGMGCGWGVSIQQ